MSKTYVPRLIDGLLNELFGQVPPVLLVGPRATGKTTTAARVVRTPAEAQTVVWLPIPALVA